MSALVSQRTMVRSSDMLRSARSHRPSPSPHTSARTAMTALWLAGGTLLWGACTTPPSPHDAGSSSVGQPHASSTSHDPRAPLAVAKPNAGPPAPLARPPVASKQCTDMACLDGIHIGLEPMGAWPAGNYVFDIDADGQHRTCHGTLPLPVCGTRALSCTGDLDLSIVESGCAMPPATHAFGDIDLRRNDLKHVHVKISHNGKPRIDQQIDPTYRTVQPNGEGCGPICTQASAQLKVF